MPCCKRRAPPRQAPDQPRDILERGVWTSLFLEREVNESIACNSVAKSSKKALRRALFDARLHASREPGVSDALSRRLFDMLRRHAPQRVGFYWPLEGEFDARGAIATWLALDAAREASLPVVTQRNAS